jgi:N-succinyldiaminopimelate aminotransferase
MAAKPGMVNMSQGMPDFAGSSVARRAAQDAIDAGGAAMNQYSPQPGLLTLRQAVSSFVSRRYGHMYEATSEVAITAGGQEALAASFLAFCDPGDEVIVFEPFYPFMLGAIHQAGAIPRVVTLRAPDFSIDEAALREAAASPNVRMLVLNSPHNPTGHVVNERELGLIADVCKQHDLLAISDEVYEHCVFPGNGAWHRQLAAVEGMRERTLTISSGGKLFGLTGWRVAWTYGPAALVGPVSAAHTHLTFNAPTPLQVGVAAALESEDGLDETAPLFGENFDRLADALREATSVRSICVAHGGYFLVAETDGRSDIDFVTALAEEKGVVGTPMSVFYATPFPEDAPCQLVRFTICKSREHVRRACENLRA